MKQFVCETTRRNPELKNDTVGRANLDANELMERIREFARERDWEQFHTPKNLSMALSVETAEILELFQWLTPRESMHLKPEKKEALRDEIGDVLIYLLNLADKSGIDPLEAAFSKLSRNAQKYPAEMVRGKALKYSEYAPAPKRKKSKE